MKIYIPDIECDSCSSLIKRTLNKNSISCSVDSESIEIEEKNKNKTIDLIKSLGYRASTEPFERMSFKERFKHFKEKKEKYQVERLGLKYGLHLSIALVLLFAFSYFFVLKNLDVSNYYIWLFYLGVSIVSILMAFWHYNAYISKFTCMTGMMIGMTFGMQTGMMIGAVIGATNGFFWGAMIGMILGTFIGVQTGKCCGIMGVMEGAMAGVMGGTMGSMITVMMYSDHIQWFMPIYMAINVFITAGFSYMLYEEIEGKKHKIDPLDGMTLISLGVIVAVLLGLFILFGPSSALISF